MGSRSDWETMKAAAKVLEDSVSWQTWEHIVLTSRDDVNVFLERSFRDDQTPGAPPFQQQWFHREWQAMWNARISVLHGPTGFGKSEQIIGRTLWEIGKDPTRRVARIHRSPVWRVTIAAIAKA